MLTSADFLFLPFTPDLTWVGIISTCRSLRELPHPGKESIYFVLRRQVASASSKLAFYRLLEDSNVAHRNVILRPFTNPDETDIMILGRRIEWVNLLISQAKSIERITCEPEAILSAPMMVDLSDSDLSLIQAEDLLLFSLSLGRTTAHLSELKKGSAPDMDKFLFYPLPVQWALPGRYQSLGRLIMKSEHDPQMSVEMGGRDERGVFFTHSQVLPARIRIEIEREVYSLTYLHVSDLPAGRISIYSPGLKQTCTIHPHEWGNLWVYGSRIVLVGYISWHEFLRKAYDLPAGSLAMGAVRLPTKHRAVNTCELHPIRDLIPVVRDDLGEK